MRYCMRSGVRAAPTLKYLSATPAYTEHFFESDGNDSEDQGPTGGLMWDGRVNQPHEQAALPLLSPFEMGNASPAEVPAKARYLDVDLQRWAQAWGLQFESNPAFPINSLALMRGAVATQMQGDEPFQRYMQAMYHAMFGAPRNMGDPAEVTAVLTAAGFDAAQFMAQIGQQAVKDPLKDNTQRAVERGVFGAPSFFVGDELFWGQDRLDQVAQALARA